MELMEKKGTEEEWKLPKNIRQVGEPGQGTKVLIEDYAYTYLHQLAEENLTCMKTAVLVGRAESTKRIYIQGAFEVDMGQEQSLWFSNEHWRDIFQTMQSWFDGAEVVGWFLTNPGFPPVLTETLKSLHNRHFPGEQYVFFQMDVMENEEIFYQRGGKSLAPLGGYYIYYEKNDKMQAYMSRQRGGAGIEPEGILRDKATTRFRNVMQEKREQNAQKRTLAFLYTASMFLVMVILVIGVTMINNYDRMANMESAIHRISESLDESGDEEAADIAKAAEEENQQAVQEDLQNPQQMEEQAEEGNGEDTQPQGETVDFEDPSDSGPQDEPEPEVQEAVSQAVKEPERYRVKAGDTLLDICRSRYGDENMVGEICRLNGLDNGDVIYVGQTIVLP